MAQSTVSRKHVIQDMTPEELKRVGERFWRKVANCENPDNCWTWQASCDRYGYGKFSLGRKIRQAHQVAYELTNGPIPTGLVICHRCDNPPCVNPSHLFAASQLTNIADMVQKGRSIKQTGQRNHNVKLTADQVREIRAKYATGQYTYKQLGQEYGVHLDTIGRIIKRKNWTHI